MNHLTFPENKAKKRLRQLKSQGLEHPLHKKGFLIDIDGVICRGRELIEGADETVNVLRENGKKTIFVSNNSTKSPHLYREKMLDLGVEVEEKDLVLATVVAAEHIRRESPASKVYVVGDDGLRETMEENELATTEKPMQAGYVVVGNPFKRDGKLRDGNDGRITGAVRSILENDARFVAVNVDTIFPTEEGPVPATGAIVKAIAHATGRAPDLVAGKPRKHIVSLALDRLDLEADQCVLIGDSKVDMKVAHRSGLQSVFVKTGATEIHELEEGDLTPDFVLDSIKDILRVKTEFKE